MKKNFFRCMVLVLGIVVSLGLSSFAEDNLRTHNFPNADTNRLTGYYKFSHYEHLDGTKEKLPDEFSSNLLISKTIGGGTTLQLWKNIIDIDSPSHDEYVIEHIRLDCKFSMDENNKIILIPDETITETHNMLLFLADPTRDDVSPTENLSFTFDNIDGNDYLIIKDPEGYAYFEATGLAIELF